ncbi:nuclear transport factor 2 family protein [Streptomyces europaeiscabiei]|uniref:nuclear transport factor 2 family protein n=1 Tax=Streptomyces europaeiscabiei TaxID=146819 RepID=UPI0006285C69|nr:nuclear transport factor 2 family protein [Streptomyces europaeiscabiei]MDX2530096.1 nuclear transport factor 2 family protein [Streptomyces europaeiscabiei]MDX2765555.1 nuclear transport factor 2 family protein [Streptomyces europaeiscabiei]MDX3782219.1 nuclear transport factor 2 family protein [Streptomyces europaeiscabiei]WSG24394.1 nuclear transport factor 2 family protein [Streptomyces europaeiscabiei]
MTPTTPARRALVAVLAAVALTSTVAVVPAVAAPTAVAERGAYGDAARVGHYQKAVAVRVLKGVFEDGDTAVVDRYVRPDYIQHNPLAPDGAETLKGLAAAVSGQFPDAVYDIERVVSQGDLVLVHSNVVLTPGTRGSAVFDIFRFQGGRIAEHWDVAQEVPESSANGNDMFSTVSRPRTSEPGPAWLTSYNEKLVTKAFDRLLVRKDLSAIDTYWGPEYHQHNPNIPDGVAGVRAGLGAYFQQFPDLAVSRKRVIAEGDLVAVHSHYVNAPGERGQAVLDLFRVRNGKIVEHWDVLQDVPATSANDNTMF